MLKSLLIANQNGEELKKAIGKQKKHKKKMDKALKELRTKKEILKEDYGISYTQARQLNYYGKKIAI